MCVPRQLQHGDDPCDDQHAAGEPLAALLQVHQPEQPDEDGAAPPECSGAAPQQRVVVEAPGGEIQNGGVARNSARKYPEPTERYRRSLQRAHTV